MNDKVLSALHEFFNECHAVADSKGWHDRPIDEPASDAEFAVAFQVINLLDLADVVEGIRKDKPSLGVLTSIEFRERLRNMPPARIKLLSKIMLMVTELAEAAEHIVMADPKDDILSVHINRQGAPDGVAVELADTIIRIGDDVVTFGLPIIEALSKKFEYNKTRPHRHGNNAL